MKILRKIIVWTLVAINLAAVVALAVSSYSIYLSPARYPNWSYLGMVLPACIVATLAFIPLWLILKWKYTLISIAGIAICWPSIRHYCPINIHDATPQGPTLKVLSYNVFSFGGKALNDGDSSIINYILQSDADIACLQEVNKLKNRNVLSRFEQVFPYILTDDSTELKNCLMSKYPILASHQISQDTKSSSSCVYHLLVDTDTVIVINNHLESYQLDDDDKQMYKQLIKTSAHIATDPQGDEPVIDMKESFWWLEGKLAKANALRARQADNIAAEIDRLTSRYRHIIVCGDFNDSPVSYVHQRLTRHLDDAYTQSGNGPGWSYNRNAMYFRIDHILISQGFTSYGAKVDKTVHESDHYPIFCTLEIH